MLCASWIGGLLLSGLTADTPQAASLAIDHVFIAVTPDAPERDVLEKAGFLIAKEVSHQAGQGTASITVEFENFYLELIWPDSSVPVDPGLERAPDGFRNRMLWATTGWCPFGLGLRWTVPKDSALPVPTRTLSPSWLPAGTSLQMLTPKDDVRSPLVFISPREVTDPDEQAARAAQYSHPIGVRRLTGLRLLAPAGYKPIPALAYLTSQVQLSLGRGQDWALELTFDGGKQKGTKDLRPGLPLVVRY